VLNSPGIQDGGFLLEVNGEPVIDRKDVFYRDYPQEPDTTPVPSCDPDSYPEDGHGLLGSLLGWLIKSQGNDARQPPFQAPLDSSTAYAAPVPSEVPDSNAQMDPQAQQITTESNGNICVDDPPRTDPNQERGEPIGFQGMFFRYVL
jgi:hypothetical protein